MNTGPIDEPIRLKTTVHQQGDEVPEIDVAQIRLDNDLDAESEPLLPPQRTSLFFRLVTLSIITWLMLQWFQGTVWSWAISPWLGGGIALIGVGVMMGLVVLAWRARAASRKLDLISRMQQRIRHAQRAHNQPSSLVPELAAEIDVLYQRSPLNASLREQLAAVDASWSVAELAQGLNSWYGPLDQEAAQLIRRESVRTGIFIAASPYPALDLLLVAWRNIAMVERVADIYGLRLSAPARWHLYQLILRNIAFTTVTETMLDSVSQTWLSNILLQVGVRAGQGIGVALYSLRIGHQSMRLCRVVPESDPLIDRNIGKLVIDSVRNRSSGGG